jgi:hypothetical protein
MKLKGTDIIATTAIALGTGQMMVHGMDVYRNDDVSSYSLPSALIGVSASLLWTLYQFNKEGMNYSVVYSGFGFALQLYILQKLLSSRRNKDATENRND